MASRAARLWGTLFFGIINLTLPATAQESTFSADSLMAAFDKGSKALKGAEIAFRGVVVENRNSKLVFRSSETYKVICDLSGSAAYYSQPPSVGSMVTVTGKVRGRGLLGNVTLDNCSLALSAALPVSTQPAPEELARPSPDRITEKESTVASLPNQEPRKEESRKEESRKEEPRKEESRKEEFRKEEPRIEEPRKKVETRSVQPFKPRKAIVNQETNSPGRVEPQDQTTNKSAEPRNIVSYKFYALLILGGALGYAILSYLLAAAVRAKRDSRPPSTVNPPEVRQAALELLLLKAEKKK